LNCDGIVGEASVSSTIAIDHLAEITSAHIPAHGAVIVADEMTQHLILMFGFYENYFYHCQLPLSTLSSPDNNQQ